MTVTPDHGLVNPESFMEASLSAGTLSYGVCKTRGIKWLLPRSNLQHDSKSGCNITDQTNIKCKFLNTIKIRSGVRFIDKWE